MSGKELAELRLNDMGFIFQQMYMLKNLTVLDNIILPAVQSKKNTKSRKEKMEHGQELMRRLGIIEAAGNDINEVSGGQLQRACICRSMINDPDIIFADEPTGALNRNASDEVMEELSKLNSDGTAVMLVTHDARVAARCERVIFIMASSPWESIPQERKCVTVKGLSITGSWKWAGKPFLSGKGADIYDRYTHRGG